MAAAAAPATIDAYIAAAPADVRPTLERIRATIREAAPEAHEKIGYGMPAFALDGDLVYFGAFKHHIGFFPPVRDPELAALTQRWQGEKGNLRFPLDAPIPYDVIARIVTARVRENRKRAQAKRSANAQPRAKAPR